jgi:hypothetical protein
MKTASNPSTKSSTTARAACAISSYELIRTHPDVIQIDVTYKANRFNMPLYHAAGTTNRGKLFDMCFGFMASETSRDYGWHVQSMRELFEWLQVIPRCFVTDDDTSPKAALTALYPNVPNSSVFGKPERSSSRSESLGRSASCI